MTNPIKIVMLLDSSGSMGVLKNETIQAFNSFIASQKEFKYKDKQIKWQQVPIVTNYQTALSRIIDYKATDSESG